MSYINIIVRVMLNRMYNIIFTHLIWNKISTVVSINKLKVFLLNVLCIKKSFECGQKSLYISFYHSLKTC